MHPNPLLIHQYTKNWCIWGLKKTYFGTSIGRAAPIELAHDFFIAACASIIALRAAYAVDVDDCERGDVQIPTISARMHPKYHRIQKRFHQSLKLFLSRDVPPVLIERLPPPSASSVAASSLYAWRIPGGTDKAALETDWWTVHRDHHCSRMVRNESTQQSTDTLERAKPKAIRKRTASGLSAIPSDSSIFSSSCCCRSMSSAWQCWD